MPYDFNYQPQGSVLRDFHLSEKYFRGLRGHVGSGKSVACAVELFLNAMKQEPGRDGLRQTRAAIVRNTTPQLKTTTIKTWLEWFPEEIFGKIKWDPPITQMMRFGDVEMENIFLALDTEKDIRKLLSLELTFAWANEAREIMKEIIDALTQRVGRYPSPRSGADITRRMVIADTNPPGPHHWWAIMSGEVAPPEYMTADDLLTLVKPQNWEFFAQPPAMLPVFDQTGAITRYDMNPDRENQYLKDEYYLDMLAGKTRDWIAVYILNQYAELFSGRPVYPDFNEKLHETKDLIDFFPDQPVYVGMDFGLTPAAVFAQRIRGRWFVQRELVCFNMGISKFADRFTQFAAEHFPGATFRITGDPSGDNRGPDEDRVFEILDEKGIRADPATTNDPGTRIDGVAASMVRLIDGKPGYLISSQGCPVLTAAKKGGYHYAKNPKGMDKDKPEKNEYSHVSDAEQYMFDGAGETRHIGQNRMTKPTKMKRNFSPFHSSPFSARVKKELKRFDFKP